MERARKGPAVTEQRFEKRPAAERTTSMPARVSTDKRAATSGPNVIHALDASPRLRAQRKQLRNVFGTAAHREVTPAQPQAPVSADRYARTGGIAATRPVARAATSDDAPIQRYTRLPVNAQRADYFQAGEPLRVSDDGKMAVVDGSRRMWATWDVVARAENALLSQKSVYSLMLGDETLVGSAPGGKGGFHRLHKVVPVNYYSGSMGDDLTTLEACSTHGQQLIGALLPAGAGEMAEGMAVVTRTGHLDAERERKYDKRGGEGVFSDEAVLKAVRSEVSGTVGEGSQASQSAYANLSERQRARLARKFGINQYAEPEPGEGLAAYVAVDKLKKGWHMHFAGVIAKSGADYVTLENFARSDIEREEGSTTTASKEWYYKMYGPVKRHEDQSFFGEQAPKRAGREGTMVLRHRHVAGYLADPVFEAARGAMVLCRNFAEHAKDEQFPRLKKAYYQLRTPYQKADREYATAWLEGRQPAGIDLLELDHLLQALQETAAFKALAEGKEPQPE